MVFKFYQGGLVKNVFVAALSLLFASGAFAASEGIRVVYDVKTVDEGKSLNMETKYFVQNNSVRFETNMPGNEMGAMTMLGKPQDKQFVMLMDSQKMYMQLPEPEARASKDAKSTEVPFKPKGERKTIAGYGCEVYQRDVEGRHEEACTSTELNDFFVALQKAMPKSDQVPDKMPGGMNGFPLEYVVMLKKSNKTELEMKAKELKREKLDAKLFEIPKGYQRMEIPSFGGGFDGKMPKPEDFMPGKKKK
jgi:hypothetical protein